MDNDMKSPIIDPARVGPLMQDRNVVIVDARGGADSMQRYMAGHLDGAVHMDLETDLSEKASDAANGGRHPLPDPKKFAALLANAGITPSSHILVYDDKAGANAAARFWWMMKAAGHSRVQVIDGGLDALRQEGYAIGTTPRPSRTPAPLYPVTRWKLPLANIEAVDRARNEKELLVIDVREGYRYRGESEPIDAVAGHIPGAVNIPYLNNLGPEGRFRDARSLASHYRNAIGNRPVENVIVHCGSGVTACHTVLAMEAAGIGTPTLYVGSWSEWSRNAKPIATGEKP